MPFLVGVIISRFVPLQVNVLVVITSRCNVSIVIMLCVMASHVYLHCNLFFLYFYVQLLFMLTFMFIVHIMSCSLSFLTFTVTFMLTCNATFILTYNNMFNFM